MLKGFRNKIRGYIPFTNWWLVERHLDKTAENILDLGCGTGRPMLFLNRHKKYKTVGIDGFAPYIEKCKEDNTHDIALVSYLPKIPYKDNSFDVVLCLQTIEHFDKEMGLMLIKRMGNLARKQVILTTDLGREEQEATADGNELQKHRHIWSVAELREAGFKVYGIGIKEFVDSWWINTLLQVFLGWVTYYKPEWAGSVLCVEAE